MIVETCFQRLYRVIEYVDSEYNIVNTCDKYLLLFMTKSKQNCILSQKRCSNGNIGVNGYADSFYV